MNEPATAHATVHDAEILAALAKYERETGTNLTGTFRVTNLLRVIFMAGMAHQHAISQRTTHEAGGCAPPVIS